MWDPSLDEIILYKTTTFFKKWKGDFAKSPQFRYRYPFAHLGDKLKVAYNKETKFPIFDPLELDVNGFPIINWDIDNYSGDNTNVAVESLASYIDKYPSKYIAIKPTWEPYWNFFKIHPTTQEWNF